MCILFSFFFTIQFPFTTISNRVNDLPSSLQALHFSRCNNLQISGLTHVDSPKGHISITHSNNVTLSNLHILAPQDSPNTDGVDISVSEYVNIRDSIIATGNLNSSFVSLFANFKNH